MRRRFWCITMVLATLGVACGDQPTEVVVDEEAATGGRMVRASGGLADATATGDDGLTISTDKDDYQPGDTVYLTGAEWPAGDVVELVLTDTPQTHPPHEWAVDVAEDGTFRDSTYVVDEGDLDVTFTLVATSRSTQRSLSLMFTDANISNNVALTPNPLHVPRGGSGTTTVTVNFGGNDDNCTADLSVSGLPTGAAGTFNPTSVTGNPTNTGKTSILTITTSASTPLGPDPYTVTAAAGSGCDGSSRQASGTLTVFGPAARLAFGQQPTTTIANATMTPSVTVLVQDVSGNLVANSTIPVTLTITTNPGAGSLTGTVTRNAVGGVATFDNLSIDKVASGYRLTASGGGLPAATSGLFNIVFGPPAALVFSTQPSGGTANAAFTTQPVVQVRDAVGNVIMSGSGSNASVALSIVAGTGTAGAVLACTTGNTRTAVAGVAAFSGCTIDRAGTSYRLRATSGSITADSDPFDVAASNRAPTVDAGTYTIAEGAELLLAPMVNDPDDDPLTYEWSVNTAGIDAGGICTFDDATARNARITCTDDSQAAGGGRFVLTLEVHDGSVLVSDNANLTVTNADPVASAGGPYAGDEGLAVQLGGSANDAGDNDDSGLTYKWTAVTTGIDAGGACTFDNDASKTATVTCTDDGAFKVRLVAKDDDGGTSAVSEANLTVANAGPVAEAGGPYSGKEGSPVQLNGTVTDAGANDTHVWLWKYTDGSGIDGGTCSLDNENAQDPTITCTDDGTIQLTLKVTDDDGSDSEDTATLTLANVDPVANAGGSYTGTEGTAVQLNGSVTDAGSNDTHTWAWQYVGTNVDPGASCSISSPTAEDPSITCTDDGTVKLTLTVNDDDGASDSDEATLTLTNVAPVASAGGPYLGAKEGTGVTLDGSVTDRGTNDSHTYKWTVDDSGIDAGGSCMISDDTDPLATVTCDDNGTLKVRVVATDDDGGVSTASEATIAIANVAPVISLFKKTDGSDLPATIIVAGSLGLKVTFGDDGLNDSHTLEVDCGGGSFATPAAATSPATGSCTFATIGSRVIRVKVADDDAGEHILSHTILVKYDFDGFYAPVDRPSTMNVSKAGQAIPLKWTLRDANGVAVTNLATVTIKTVAVSCDQTVSLDPLEEYAGSTSGLLNLGDGRYQFNWKTPTTYAGTCKSIALVFASGGLSYTEGPHAFFTFKK